MVRNFSLLALIFILCGSRYALADKGNRSYLGFSGGYAEISGQKTLGAGMYFGINWGDFRAFGLEAYADYRNWYRLAPEHKFFTLHAGARMKLRFMRFFFIRGGGGAFMGRDIFSGSSHIQNNYELVGSGGLQFPLLSWKTQFTLEAGTRYFLKPIFTELNKGTNYGFEALAGILFYF
jgi:hypothetical protein